MQNSAETAQTGKNPVYGNTAKGAMNVASTLQYLQDANKTGGQKLAKIISTIMSFGGSAGKDAVEGT